MFYGVGCRKQTPTHQLEFVSINSTFNLITYRVANLFHGSLVRGVATGPCYQCTCQTMSVMRWLLKGATANIHLTDSQCPVCHCLFLFSPLYASISILYTERKRSKYTTALSVVLRSQRSSWPVTEWPLTNAVCSRRYTYNWVFISPISPHPTSSRLTSFHLNCVVIGRSDGELGHFSQCTTKFAETVCDGVRWGGMSGMNTLVDIFPRCVCLSVCPHIAHLQRLRGGRSGRLCDFEQASFVQLSIHASNKSLYSPASAPTSGACLSQSYSHRLV